LLGVKTPEVIDFPFKWVVDPRGPKEAQVQSYSPGGGSVPSWEGECDWTVRLWGRCGRMSNHFDLLFDIYCFFGHICERNTGCRDCLWNRSEFLLLHCLCDV